MLSLDQDTEQPKISLDGDNVSPVLSTDQVNTRATKAHFAVGDLLPDENFQTIHNAISTGNEDKLRNKTASAYDVKKVNDAWNYIQGQIQNKNISPQDVQSIASNAEVKSNPNTILEERYGYKYMSALNYSNSDPNAATTYKEAINKIPEETNSIVNSAQGLVVHNELVHKYIQDNEAAIEKQSYLGYGFDFAKSALIPFYNEAIARQNYTSLFGTDLERQAQEFYSMNNNDAADWLKSNYERISSHNLQLASSWLRSLLGQSSSEKVLSNIGTGVDIATVAAPIAKLTGLNNAVIATAKSMVKGSVAADTVGPARTAAAASGNLGRAGEIGASKEVMTTMAGHGEPLKDAIEHLPSIVKINSPVDAGNFGQENANRLLDTIEGNNKAIIGFMKDHPEIERTPDLMWTPDNMAKLSEYIKDSYKFDNVLNIIPEKDNFGQWNAKITLGQGSEYFQTQLQAEKWLSFKGIIDGKIKWLDGSELGVEPPAEGHVRFITNDGKYVDVPKGDPAEVKARADMFPGVGDLGYSINAELPQHWRDQLKDFPTVHGPVYIELSRPIEETAPFIRDTLASTPQSQSKKGFANSFIGWARTPEDTQAPMELANRKVVDNGPSVLRQMFRKIGEPLTKLSKDEKVDWDRFILDQQNTGKWAETPLELEGMYQQFSNGLLPSHNFVNAYFGYKQAKFLQKSIEDMSEYKQAHRRGNLTIKIRMEDKDGNPTYSNSFNATPVDSVPRNAGGVYLTGAKPGSDMVVNEGSFASNNLLKEGTDMNAKVKSGEKRVYRIDDPDAHPLNGFGKVRVSHGHRPVYVVGDNIEESNLSLNTKQFKPEASRRMDHGHVLVQARTFREGNTVHYVEDVPMAAHDSRATLEDLGKEMNIIQDHIANGRIEEAKQHHMDKGLPMDWGDLYKKYLQGRTASGKFLAPEFNKTEPWQVIPSNKMLIEMPNNGIEERYTKQGLKFNDTTKELNARKQGMYDLLQSRDAQDIFSVKNSGTHDNPVWDLAPVRYIDPMTSMNRAFSNVTKSLFMNDFKWAAVENWLEEGRKADIFSREVRDAPFWNYKRPPYKTGLDAATKRQFENTKFQIDQFLGVPSQLDQTLHSWSQNLADSIYSRWNPDHYGPIQRSMLLTPSWALGNVTNGLNFARSFAFNTMMGMFNPVHLFLWTMNYSNIFGIAGPIRAGQGTFGAVLHQMSRMNKNPEVLDYLDKLASRMGFKPGEWKEANEAADKYGWGLGRRELSFQPHELNPKIFQSGVNKFIDSGQIFLRGADRNLQYGAWYTAYKEYREANSISGQLTNKDWLKVMDRADLLSSNMGNASRSALQNGAMGFPTQFLSYQLRMWEMFMGKRLTGTEKIRLLSTYGLLFGLPASAGLVGGPIPIGTTPFGERIRQTAIEHGYVTGDGAGITTVMEGFLGQLSHLVTGTYLNVGKRYGDYGIDLSRDKTWWDIIGGAAGSQAANILSSTNGFWHMVQTFMSGTEKFQPTSQDLIDIAQNIQTITIGNRALTALNTGNWVSRNGTILENKVSPDRAVIQSLLGLTSQAQEDVITRDVSLKEQEASWRRAELEATKNYHLGIQAQKNNDPEQAHTYFQRSRIILDWARVPNERWKDWMRNSSNTWESTIDKSIWDYYMLGKNAPQGSDRLDTARTIRNNQ